MRLVSRLIKLDIQITEIYPENDKLVLKGKSGTLESTVLVEPHDMVKLIRLVTSRRTILFLLKSTPRILRSLFSDVRPEERTSYPR